MSALSLIHADWPSRPFGVTWHRLADVLRMAGLADALRGAGHAVEEAVLRADGADAADLRGGMRLAGDVARHIRAARQRGALAIVICGSCSVAAVAASAALGPEGLAIAWFDAHPDLNTPQTSLSGLTEGMALAMALGRCWQAMTAAQAGLVPARDAQLAFFGARDLDPPEQAVIEAEGWPIFGTETVTFRNMANLKNLYVHLDMDVHDALIVRTNSFAVPEGPGVDEVRAALSDLARTAPFGCLAVTGLDPAAIDAERAAQIAIDHIRAVADAWETKHA